MPYNDFIGIAISSQTYKIHSDEMIIDNAMLKSGSLPKTSKLMLRKSFIIDKDIILKKYGELTHEEFFKIRKAFLGITHVSKSLILLIPYAIKFGKNG